MSLIGSGPSIGGLVGTGVSSTSLRCASMGKVRSDDLTGYAGGIVGSLAGYQASSMVESWSLADVTGILNAGGLIGNATCNGPENCTVENNWAGGVVTGINAGGLFGTMGGLAPENWNTGRMFSISRIQNYGSNGGITESEVPIPSTYWDLERSVTPLSGAGEGKSTAEMLDAATYSGWNFGGTWTSPTSTHYPCLAARPLNLSVRSLRRWRDRCLARRECDDGNLIQATGATVPVSQIQLSRVVFPDNAPGGEPVASFAPSDLATYDL